MKRICLFLILGSISLGLAAERPEHRPQTIAETFLRAMQVRDFATARACVLPSQSTQFTMIANWSNLSGWLAVASFPTDFPVLRSYRTATTMDLDYDLGDRGTARVEMRKSGQGWYLDLAATEFQPNGRTVDQSFGEAANSTRTPSDRTKLFVDALQRSDFKQAGSVGTPRTVAILKLIAALAPFGESKGAVSGPTEVVSENIEGEAATVRYRGADSHEHSLNLIRVGNDWMVDLGQDQLDF